MVQIIIWDIFEDGIITTTRKKNEMDKNKNCKILRRLFILIVFDLYNGDCEEIDLLIFALVNKFMYYKNISLTFFILSLLLISKKRFVYF